MQIVSIVDSSRRTWLYSISSYMYLHITKFLDLPAFLLRPTKSLSGLWALVVDSVLEVTVFSVA